MIEEKRSKDRGYIHNESLQYLQMEYYKKALLNTNEYWEEYNYQRVFHTPERAKQIVIDNIVRVSKRLEPSETWKEYREHKGELSDVDQQVYATTQLEKFGLADPSSRNPVTEKVDFMYKVLDFARQCDDNELKVLAWIMVTRNVINPEFKFGDNLDSHLTYWLESEDASNAALIKYIGSKRQYYKAKESLERKVKEAFGG